MRIHIDEIEIDMTYDASDGTALILGGSLSASFCALNVMSCHVKGASARRCGLGLGCPLDVRQGLALHRCQASMILPLSAGSVSPSQPSVGLLRGDMRAPARPDQAVADSLFASATSQPRMPKQFVSSLQHTHTAIPPAQDPSLRTRSLARPVRDTAASYESTKQVPSPKCETTP